MIDIEMLINKIITTKKPAVFAMIVDVEGAPYQKEGTWMLCIEGDTPIGMISRGSFEDDLHLRSERLFNTGQAEMISYDLNTEDKSGIVHILLRDIDNNFRKALTSAREILCDNEPVLYIQSMKDFSQYIFSYEQEDTFGFWDSDTDWEWIHAKPPQTIVGRRNFGNQTYFIQLIWP